MANRVILESARLSISQPGFDVLTAGPSNMIFDSRFGEYGGVFMTGHATGYTITIPFGRTLPRAPVVWAAGRSGSTWVQVGYYEGDHNSPNGISCGATTTEAIIYNMGGHDLIRYAIFNIGAS